MEVLLVLFSIKATRKIATVMLVSRWQWWELSAWSTARSSLKGWRAEVVNSGLRHTNPLFGIAVNVAGRCEGYEEATEGDD